MYKIEMLDGDRWVAVGGEFQTEIEAREKVAQYKLCGSEKRPKVFRVVRL